jgi:hypothetical protein
MLTASSSHASGNMFCLVVQIQLLLALFRHALSATYADRESAGALRFTMWFLLKKRNARNEDQHISLF